MRELTQKQQYQREYYQKNKDKICAKKRSQYKPKAKCKTRRTSPKNITAPARATSPIKEVNKMPKKTRHKIEDILLARELGVSIDKL
ncbi:TPA: hypothetical protein ACVO3A_000147 [Vibrio diabolicus]|nr:hypothetical protein [Vibrio parahaemolyticus]